MTAQISILGKTTLEYLDRFPNLPSLSLARKIYAENPEVYNSIEHARSNIRHYRGAQGKEKRDSLVVDRHAVEWNSFNFPESEGEDYDPFIITGRNKTLIAGDFHVPYHDVESMNVMFRYAQDRDITSVILNGDFWDFHMLSYFIKDPRKRNIRQELDIGKAVLRKIREIFPTQKIYFKIGNHEERWEKYLMTRAPELFDIADFHLENLFPFLELGIECITGKRIIKLGKLNVLHGHELQLRNINVNPARSTFLKTYESTIVNHTHRSSEHTEPNLSEEVITCWSIGAMCWLHPEYSPINKWNHGFATVQTDDDGYFNVKNRRIINGEVR